MCSSITGTPIDTANWIAQSKLRTTFRVLTHICDPICRCASCNSMSMSKRKNLWDDDPRNRSLPYCRISIAIKQKRQYCTQDAPKKPTYNHLNTAVDHAAPSLFHWGWFVTVNTAMRINIVDIPIPPKINNGRWPMWSIRVIAGKVEIMNMTVEVLVTWRKLNRKTYFWQHQMLRVIPFIPGGWGIGA